ncbi:MAG TPA: glycosyl hydrolase [Actinomycetes bacterium]|nr:glycosyl hydrolase [Actinomycetes bacterium]
MGGAVETRSVDQPSRRRRRPGRRAGVAVLVVLALVVIGLGLARPWSHGSAVALPVLPSVAPQPLPDVASGVYCGGTGTSCVTSFEQWRGRSVGIVGAYLPQSTWADIQVPAWWAQTWASSPYRDRMLITVPMLPNLTWTTMSAGAQGQYDVYFRHTALNLVAAGLGNAWIRIGPELNGTWFRWSAQPDPLAYQEYFRHIVDAMRSVPGQSFRFDWNVAVGGDLHMDATLAYPGDAYVDAIGEDVYDMKWNDPHSTPESRWDHLVDPTGPTAQGLEFWARFAAQHDKPLSYGEWGLVGPGSPMAKGGGGGDDPAFIDHMHQWFGTHTTAFEVYFNRNPPDGRHVIDDGSFPQAAARYQQLF